MNHDHDIVSTLCGPTLLVDIFISFPGAFFFQFFKFLYEGYMNYIEPSTKLHLIRNELDWDFDEEKVVADIKHSYPGWGEEWIYTEIDKLDDIYEEECSRLLEPIVKTTVKACLAMVEEFRKEGKV